MAVATTTPRRCGPFCQPRRERPERRERHNVERRSAFAKSDEGTALVLHGARPRGGLGPRPVAHHRGGGSRAAPPRAPDGGRTGLPPSPPFRHWKGYSNDDDDTDGDGGAAGQGGHMYARMTDNRMADEKYNVCLDALMHNNRIAQYDTMEFYFLEKNHFTIYAKNNNRSSDHWLFSVWLCI